MEFTKPVVDEIVASCTSGETGARNIDAIIDRRLIPEISTQVLGFMADGKMVTNLKVGKKKDGTFTYNFTE
jgi:type VI secretion system protein VasG